MSIQKGVGRTITFGSIATAGTANTSTTPACVVDKDGAGQNATTNSPTHQGVGSWKIALTSAEMTADLVSFTATGSGLVPTYREIYTESDYTTARAAKLDDLDAPISTRSTFAGGAVASVTAPVTAGTVSDKTGYTLTVTPPTTAAITTAVVAGMATAPVGSVASPVTAGTVTDKTGYSLATAPPTAADVTTAVVAGMASAPVGSVSGDLGGKVIGGGSGTITGVGANTNTVDVNGEPVVSFDGVLQSYTTSGGFSVVQLATTANAADDFYNGRLFETLGGTGPEQSAFITAYVGATRTATLSKTLAIALDDTTEYSTTAQQAVGLVSDKAGYALSSAGLDVVPVGSGNAREALGNLDVEVSTRSTFVPAAVLPTPRDLSTAADSTITYNDALWSVIASAAGKESVSGINYVVKTPAGTVIRTFTLTLDANQNPTARA